MVLVQLFLPVYSNVGTPFPRALFDQVRHELTERFGGVTAYVRSPAVGAWEDDSGGIDVDDIYLFEVMATELERDWWQGFRLELEQRFAQDEVMLRALVVERL